MNGSIFVVSVDGSVCCVRVNMIVDKDEFGFIVFNVSRWFIGIRRDVFFWFYWDVLFSLVSWCFWGYFGGVVGIVFGVIWFGCIKFFVRWG